MVYFDNNYGNIHNYFYACSHMITFDGSIVYRYIKGAPAI